MLLMMWGSPLLYKNMAKRLPGRVQLYRKFTQWRQGRRGEKTPDTIPLTTPEGAEASTPPAPIFEERPHSKNNESSAAVIDSSPRAASKNQNMHFAQENPRNTSASTPSEPRATEEAPRVALQRRAVVFTGGVKHEIQHYTSTAPGGQAGVTLVTAYFRIKSKHSDQEYDTWMGNTLSVQDPMVIFTNAELVDTMKGYRKHAPGKTHFITTDLEHTVMAKRHDKDFWELQRDIDPEKQRHKSYELYWIWNEKPQWMKTSAELNPFQTKYFLWIDTGYLRHPKFNSQHLIQRFPADLLDHQVCCPLATYSIWCCASQCVILSLCASIEFKRSDADFLGQQVHSPSQLTPSGPVRARISCSLCVPVLNSETFMRTFWTNRCAAPLNASSRFKSNFEEHCRCADALNQAARKHVL